MQPPRISRRLLIPALAGLLALLVAPETAGAWGDHGHTISGRAAATRLPQAMPRFFRDATLQLGYLNPEPDRWREREFREMDEAFRYDHYLDMERLTPASLEARDRYTFLSILQAGGIQRPARDVGLLHFRILELYQRLRTEFHLWRNTTDPQRRRWIEQRILNDAGVLGHYVTDGANPHHTTVHHNGWAEGYPNPNGYTTDNTFHRRFESEFVGARVTLGDLLPRIAAAPQRLQDPRADVLRYLRNSNSLVERLYQLDRQAAFNAQNTSAEHKRFAVDRLVTGVEMLRALWWTAWLESENAPRRQES
ncbi:MAG TPA: hypothetical protein VHG28_20965 [Longimicrobiaceae bacterium]|nr:hypothetical protein [Longimicrobiaceae bacterium]